MDGVIGQVGFFLMAFYGTWRVGTQCRGREGVGFTCVVGFIETEIFWLLWVEKVTGVRDGRVGWDGRAGDVAMCGNLRGTWISIQLSVVPCVYTRIVLA